MLGTKPTNIPLNFLHVKYSTELSPCCVDFSYCLPQVWLFQSCTVCIKYTAWESHPVPHKLLCDVGELEELGNTARAVISCAAPSCSALLVWASPFYDLLCCSQCCFYPSKALITQFLGCKARCPNNHAFSFLTFCFFQSQRMSWRQKNLNEERQQQEAEVTEANPAYHCHSYSRAYENRKREQQQARRKLCLASVICILFMTAEIIGEYVCPKRAQFVAQHIPIHALWYTSWLQAPIMRRGEPTWIL